MVLIMALNVKEVLDVSNLKTEIILGEFVEPLLDPRNTRLTMYPITQPEIWKMYKKHMAGFWVVESVDLSNDMKHWVKLTEGEQHFIKMILAFFAASDGIVNLNLAERFLQEIQIPEAKAFYGFQLMMEMTHSEMYSILIESYIKDLNEKTKLLNAIETIPCIKKKADWAMKWIESDKTFAHRLVAFAIVEGVFFSGAFCSIFWLAKRGLMPGLKTSNEWISRDEGLHCDFACLLYSMIVKRLDEATVVAIMKEAVDIEKEFIVDSLPCKLIGMNSSMMGQYIEFVADRLICQLGYNKIYNTKNPFEWMDLISMQNKDNFFEKRNAQYQNPHVLNETATTAFVIDEDF